MSERADALQKIKSSAKRYPEFLIDEIEDGLEPVELEKQLEPLISILSSCKPIEQDSYVVRISKRFKISKKVVQQKVLQSKGDASAPALNGGSSSPQSVPPRSGAGRVRGEVIEDIGVYYYKTPAGVDETISSFVLKPKRRIFVDGQELLQCDIECESGRVVEDFIFPKKAWRTGRDFKDCLPTPDLQWTGNDDQVQGVLRLLSKSVVPSRIGTPTMGYWEGESGPRWVWAGGAIGPDGLVSDEDVVYAPRTKLDIADRVQYELPDRADFIEIAKKVLPLLLELNKPEVILPILGWFFATPFKPRINKIVGHFPILMLWGTHGCGKTSIISKVFWRMFGFAHKTEPYSCRETYHPLMTKLSSTNSIPVFLDEFRVRDMGASLPSFLNAIRRLYGGGTEERGRADQTVSSYHLLAPVVIAGENTPDHDPATMERILPVSPDKNYIEQNARPKQVMYELQSLPIHKLAGPYVQWSLSVDVEKLIDEAREATSKLLKLIGIQVQNRPHDNIMVMIFGLLVFDAWCSTLGVETPKINTQDAVRSLAQNIIEGGDGGVKDAFDSFLECLSMYARQGLIQEDTHYAMVADRLCLHLPSCHHIYMIERKKAGLSDDTNGAKALKRLCREKHDRGDSYITAVDKRVHMVRSMVDDTDTTKLAPGFVRCVQIEMSKVPTALDVEHFPVRLNRTYGGDRYATDRDGLPN